MYFGYGGYLEATQKIIETTKYIEQKWVAEFLIFHDFAPRLFLLYIAIRINLITG